MACAREMGGADGCGEVAVEGGVEAGGGADEGRSGCAHDCGGLEILKSSFRRWERGLSNDAAWLNVFRAKSEMSKTDVSYRSSVRSCHEQRISHHSRLSANPLFRPLQHQPCPPKSHVQDSIPQSLSIKL